MMRSPYGRGRIGDCTSCQRRANGERNGTTFTCNENGNGNPCKMASCTTPRNEGVSPCEGERLLALIRRLDFALVEINLYLDTHPYSRTALNHFERILRERNQAAERYESAFGPLTAMGNGTRDEWMWSTGTWPWQIDKESKR